jgi:spermidine/putrescine transport system permease protein
VRRWLGAYAALVLALLYAPLAVMALFAFNESKYMRWTRFSTRWFAELVADRRPLDALADTLVIGAGTTIVSVALGAAIALPLSRVRFRGQRLSNALVALPVMVPDIALGIALLMFFVALHVPLGRVTVVAAQSTFGLSYAALVIAARLRGFERSIEDAALDLGATPWRAFWKVTFPAMRPGIVAAALLCFALSFDDFVITYFTTGPGTSTLPVEVYGMVRRGVSPKVNALSTILVLASLALTVLAARFARSAKPAGSP